MGITNVKAVDTNLKEEDIQKILEDYDIDLNTMDITQALELYDELTDQYTNKELIEMLEENKEELIESGVPEEAINAGTQVLKNFDAKELKKIIESEVDIDKLESLINSGASPADILSSIITTESIFNLVVKILFASMIFKTVITILVICLLIKIVLRWIIFEKAGKHGWAEIIPIYKDIVYLQVCKLSPWLLLFVFFPIIGWLILGAVYIISRFELAKAFGRGFFFGLGLLLFRTIFELIIVASSNIKYVEDSKEVIKSDE